LCGRIEQHTNDFAAPWEKPPAGIEKIVGLSHAICDHNLVVVNITE
jgi:hypothetical protein